METRAGTELRVRIRRQAVYNEPLKRSFIDAYTDSDATKTFCERIFGFTAPYEEELRKDICAWDAPTLKQVLERLSGTKSAARCVRIHILKKYAEFCVSSGVDGATMNIFHVQVTGLGKIREQMTAGPEMLGIYLDALFDMESQQTTDSVFRCAYWLAFMGVDKEESVEIKRRAVDLEKCELNCSRGILALYPESVAAFLNCVSLDAFLYRDKWMPRADGSLLLSGIRTVYSVSKLKVAMSSKAREAFDKGLTDQRLSYERVQRSGLFYRMRQMEMAGYPADFGTAADEFMSGKEYSPGGGTIEGVRGRIVSDYLYDYKQWKLAFLI